MVDLSYESLVSIYLLYFNRARDSDKEENLQLS